MRTSVIPQLHAADAEVEKQGNLSFLFSVMGTHQEAHGADNINHARELVLLQMCGMDLSNGYWDDDVQHYKHTDLGKQVWESLSKQSPRGRR